MTPFYELTAKLATKPVIVITGPQRSGTTIATRIIAEILNYRQVLQEAFDTHNEEIFTRCLARYNTVIQAPGMLHIVKDTPEHVGVVFMIRSLDRIITSEKRIGWHASKEADQEAAKYPGYNKLFKTSEHIARWKQNKWATDIRSALGDRGFELVYGNLEAHPFWVHKDDRKYWASRRTT